MFGSMSTNYHLPMFIYECPKKWFGKTFLKLCLVIVHNWWRLIRLKVRENLTFFQCMDRILSVFFFLKWRPFFFFDSLGNKKDDLTIIYTPAANLKVKFFIALIWNHRPLITIKEIRRYGCRSSFIPQRQEGTSLHRPLFSFISLTPPNRSNEVFKLKFVLLYQRNLRFSWI
jgi:hypothetical protein